jgi:hypothetical protein
MRNLKPLGVTLFGYAATGRYICYARSERFNAQR